MKKIKTGAAVVIGITVFGAMWIITPKHLPPPAVVAKDLPTDAVVFVNPEGYYTSAVTERVIRAMVFKETFAFVSCDHPVDTGYQCEAVVWSPAQDKDRTYVPTTTRNSEALPFGTMLGSTSIGSDGILRVSPRWNLFVLLGTYFVLVLAGFGLYNFIFMVVLDEFKPRGKFTLGPSAS